VLEINPRPVQPAVTGIAWTSQTVSIFGAKVNTYKLLCENPRAINLLTLHAYGSDCDGRDFSSYLPYLTGGEFNLYSVDFPGFGGSEGKKFNSRAENFSDKR